MGEIYSGVFRQNGDQIFPVGDERLIRPDAIDPPEGSWLVIGDALSSCAELLAAVTSRAVALVPDRYPRARDLLPQAVAEFEAGRHLKLEAALPVYLREADAWRRA